MAYRYHPEIEGLKVNEDGTELIYLGAKIEIKTRQRKNRSNQLRYAFFLGQMFSVNRLLCECWHGLPENSGMVATIIDSAKPLHYTNIFWKQRGFNPNKSSAKRCRSSKIKESDLPTIKKRIQQGETLKAIAADYNTSDMSISRIKKQMKND